MKIVTKGEIEYKNNEVYRTDLNVSYVQNSDGNDPEKDGAQELLIRTEDCGGGKYFVLETKRWAFDNIDDILEILKDYKKLNS